MEEEDRASSEVRAKQRCAARAWTCDAAQRKLGTGAIFAEIPVIIVEMAQGTYVSDA